MIKKIEYPVASDIILDEHWDIVVSGVKFQFATNSENIIIKITLSFKVDEQYYPTVKQTPKEKTAASINIPSSPIEHFISKQLAVIQGVLSGFGNIHINTEEAEHEWIAESDDEKKLRGIISFKKKRDKTKRTLPLAYNIAARTIIASWDLLHFDTPLAFFRQGTIETFQHRYRTAFYSYYFFIETLFGNGHFKQRQILAEFVKSQTLIESILRVRSDFLVSEKGPDKFIDLLRNAEKAKDILWHIINVRGEAHHHSATNPKAWHPEDHDEFNSIASYLHLVCLDIVLGHKGGIIFSQEIMKNFIEASKDANAYKQAKIYTTIILPSGDERKLLIKTDVPTIKYSNSTMHTVANNIIENILDRYQGAFFKELIIVGDGKVRYTLEDYAATMKVLNSRH